MLFIFVCSGEKMSCDITLERFWDFPIFRAIKNHVMFLILRFSNFEGHNEVLWLSSSLYLHPYLRSSNNKINYFSLTDTTAVINNFSCTVGSAKINYNLITGVQLVSLLLF